MHVIPTGSTEVLGGSRPFNLPPTAAALPFLPGVRRMRSHLRASVLQRHSSIAVCPACAAWACKQRSQRTFSDESGAGPF